MTRLFAEVYLDEDVSVVVAEMLKARGFKAITTQDAGRLGATDEDHVAHAASQQMVLLTHNRADFEALHGHYLAEGREHWGIIVAARRRPQQTVGNVLRLLNRLTADEMKGQLLYA